MQYIMRQVCNTVDTTALLSCHRPVPQPAVRYATDTKLELRVSFSTTCTSLPLRQSRTIACATTPALLPVLRDRMTSRVAAFAEQARTGCQGSKVHPLHPRWRRLPYHHRPRHLVLLSVARWHSACAKRAHAHAIQQQTRCSKRLSQSDSPVTSGLKAAYAPEGDM